MSKYVKTATQEMIPYEDGMDMTGISVGEHVPEIGGMIAISGEDKYYVGKAFFEANYNTVPVNEAIILEEALLSVKVECNEGVYSTKFVVSGGTVNEFTFGSDEEEAKRKTKMLTDGIIQGLEFVQNTVREQYGQAEDEAQ